MTSVLYSLPFGTRRYGAGGGPKLCYVTSNAQQCVFKRVPQVR